jgi:polo-like kinase 1
MGAYSFPEHIPLSDNIKNLIHRVLHLDPLKRLTLDEIIAHPFLNNGKGFPKFLPLSTLACPPSKNYLMQFSSNTEDLEEEDKTKEAFDNLSNIKAENQGGIVSHIPANSMNQGSLLKQDIYVKKWVDYSSKYGLGYLLSNGSSGVFFNDCTKIILDPKKE